MPCGFQLHNESKPVGLNRVVPGVVRHACVSRIGCFRTSVVPSKSDKDRNTIAYASGDVSPLPVNWKATGVPILERLKAIDTIAEANVHALQLILLVTIGTFISYNVFREFSKRALPQEEEGKHESSWVSSLAGIICTPALKLIPWLGATYLTTVMLAMGQVYIGVYQDKFATFCWGQSQEVWRIVWFLTQFFQDAVDIILIVGYAWVAKNFKDRVISYVQNRYIGGESKISGASRMLYSFGFVLNYIISGFAFLASLDAFGFDIAPLLASVGASSVIIGIASRNILENFAAAITLYTAPPFAVGDDVKLINFGSLVAEGKILAVEPLRTILLTKENTRLYISNSLIVKWMVDNLSQGSPVDPS
eukprot:jgi/Picsp_1/2821/NSC_01047-R1_mechanosensitive ion channel